MQNVTHPAQSIMDSDDDDVYQITTVVLGGLAISLVCFMTGLYAKKYRKHPKEEEKEKEEKVDRSPDTEVDFEL